jgi:hypothetical protein
MSVPDDDEGALSAETRACATFKKVVLMVAGTAMQRYGMKIESEQEVLSYLADILIDTYAAESAVLRARGAVAGKAGNAELHHHAASITVNEAAGRIELAARSALAAMADGDTLRTQLAALRRLMKITPVNTVAMRRQLADAVVSAGGYVF